MMTAESATEMVADSVFMRESVVYADQDQDSAHERATFINEVFYKHKRYKERKVEVVAAQCEINTDVMVLF